MKRILCIFTTLLGCLMASADSAQTNVLVAPNGYDRGAAVFFIDECLTRGLTNSISISDLRAWATNMIHVYQRRESVAAETNATKKRYSSVLVEDVPEAIRSMQTRIPSCRTPPPQSEDWEKFVESFSKMRSISKKDASDALCTYVPDSKSPRVGFWRSAQGTIEAVTITWYLYGIIVGPETFKAEWGYDPYYHIKLADGLYLWHGEK